MALNTIWISIPGQSLGYSILRMADQLYYDLADGTFKVTPTTQIVPLPEGTGNFVGRYKDRITPTLIANFPDGRYEITIHDLNNSNQSIGAVETIMAGGDDAPVNGNGPTAAQIDSYLSSIHGSGAWGSAGGGFTLSQIAGAVWDEPRSSHVGAGSFGQGVVLAANGVDQITVSGINLRQAVYVILAAEAGLVSGAATSTVTINGANGGPLCITATTDSSGNRTSSPTLIVPA